MGNWESMALCLPNTLLDILERDNSLELRLNDYKVVHWDKEKAIDIKPLQVNGEVLTPLDAFLKYFAK